MLDILSQITDIAQAIPGLFLSPDFNLYWGYLAGALIVASLVYLQRDADKRSLTGLIRFLFPWKIWFHRSSRHDLVMFVVNTLAYSLLILPWLLSANTVADHILSILKTWFGHPIVLLNGSGSKLFFTLFILLAADLAFYLSHRLQHKIPILWEFHKVHHSAKVLTPLTSLRRHPVDMILDGTISGILVGAAYAIMDYFSGGNLDPYTFMGVNVGLFVFLALAFNLQHSHVNLRFGPILDRLFISPAVHQIHHSQDSRHVDKNMGNIFAIWDWIAGSLFLPTTRRALRFGLAHHEERHFNTVHNLYLRPFSNLGKSVYRKISHTRQPGKTSI